MQDKIILKDWVFFIKTKVNQLKENTNESYLYVQNLDYKENQSPFEWIAYVFPL